MLLSGSALVLCALRLYQLLCATEPSTGFPVRGDISGTLLWILTPIALVLLGLAGAAKKDPGPVSFGGRRGKAAGLLFLLPAAALLWESLSGLMLPQNISAQMLPEDAPWWPLLHLLGLCAALGCLWLCMAIGPALPKKRLAVPGLALSLYLALRALLTYLSVPATVTHPATLLRILALVGLSLFYLAAARLVSGIREEQGRRWLLRFCVPGLLLAVLAVIPAAVGALFAAPSACGFSFETLTLAALTACGIQLMLLTLQPEA